MNEQEHWIWAYPPGRDREPTPRVGKWVVRIPTGVIDRVWKEYADATGNGHLGISTKRSTEARRAAAGQGSHVIVVYTRDYEDRNDVRRVLRALRVDLRVKQNLSYKTDEATLAGRYGEGVSLYVGPPGSLDVVPAAGHVQHERPPTVR